MLDNEYAYARRGAYFVLMQITGRYDQDFRFDAPPQQRQAAVRAWKEWWVKNELNPRLNSPPKRVYEAADWESEHITGSVVDTARISLIR
jgi:hypothetical protein